MFKKIKDWWVNHHGFLTEEGKGLSWVRVHAIGIGYMDGVSPWREYRLDYWIDTHEDVKEKPHYYELGHFVGKWKILIILFLIFGTSGIRHFFGII